MRVNGHNDQCSCVECGTIPNPNQLQIQTIALNDVEQKIIDRRFDTSGSHPIWGVPDLVGERSEWALPPEVRGARVVGAMELDHVAPTGRIVAVKLAVMDRDRITMWALWWDRDASALVARPLRNEREG